MSLRQWSIGFLVYLLENANKVVSKQRIFDNVWSDSFVSEGTLNVTPETSEGEDRRGSQYSKDNKDCQRYGSHTEL